MVEEICLSVLLLLTEAWSICVRSECLRGRGSDNLQIPTPIQTVFTSVSPRSSLFVIDTMMHPTTQLKHLSLILDHTLFILGVYHELE